MVDQVIVVGDKRLAATMARAGRDFAHMDGANARVAADVVSAARGRAPKRTGRLSRSITGRAAQNSAEIGSSLVYAGVIHNGWPRHHIEANPYIADVVTGQSDKWVSEYATECDKILSRVEGA